MLWRLSLFSLYSQYCRNMDFFFFPKIREQISPQLGLDPISTLFSFAVVVDNWRRQWHPIPVLLPGKSHGRRSLVGCSPWGRWELDTTQWLHFHFSLSCTGEGNGNPLQCSCLENPRTAEPGGLPSMGSHRVGHDWSDLAAAATCMIQLGVTACSGSCFCCCY